MTYIKYSINANQGRNHYLIHSNGLGLANGILKCSENINSQASLSNSLFEREVPNLQSGHKEIKSLLYLVQTLREGERREKSAEFLMFT